jgi:hypothetical protein
LPKEGLMKSRTNHPLRVCAKQFRVLNREFLAGPEQRLFKRNHKLVASGFFVGQPYGVDGEIQAGRDPLKPDQGEPIRHGLSKRPIVNVLSIESTPLVAKESVITGIVIVRTLTGVAGIHSAEAQRRGELSRFPNALLSRHEANGVSLKGEVGEISLSNTRLPVRCQLVQERERGPTEPLIEAQSKGRH